METITDTVTDLPLVPPVETRPCGWANETALPPDTAEPWAITRTPLTTERRNIESREAAEMRHDAGH